MPKGYKELIHENTTNMSNNRSPHATTLEIALQSHFHVDNVRSKPNMSTQLVFLSYQGHFHVESNKA